MDRRQFVKRSAALGASAVLGPLVPTHAAEGLTRIESQDASADIAVVSGSDFYAAVIKAVEMLGGIQRFLPRGHESGS